MSQDRVTVQEAARNLDIKDDATSGAVKHRPRWRRLLGG